MARWSYLNNAERRAKQTKTIDAFPGSPKLLAQQCLQHIIRCHGSPERHITTWMKRNIKSKTYLFCSVLFTAIKQLVSSTSQGKIDKNTSNTAENLRCNAREKKNKTKGIRPVTQRVRQSLQKL